MFGDLRGQGMCLSVGGGGLICRTPPKAQREIWLASGLTDHKYLSVKRETYGCQWTDHCLAQIAIECSGTSQTAAGQQLLGLPCQLVAGFTYNRKL